MPSDSNSLSGNVVVGFLEESANEIWIPTYGGGINKMNRQTGKFKHYLQGIFITTIYRDQSGILWAGAESGLFKYDKETDQFSFIERLNANFQIHAVRTLVDDKEGNLWVSCGVGIFKMDPKKMTASLFGLSNGVRGDLIGYGAALRSQDGRLYFGDANGYYSFFPDQISLNPGSPGIEFSELWLHGILVKPGPDGPLQTDLQDANEVILHHDQNTFSLGFNTVYYGNTADNTVYYKLENYDRDWVVADAGDRADYHNLAPGSYIFRLKVVNTINGISKEKEVAFVVLSPWWQRWWAYIIYALGLLGLIVLFDRLQRRRILSRERERNKDRELAQAREIEKAYHELKVTQTQLIQQEKMASLGELTAGIAHEIQNPLNFVNNFSDVNTELIDEASQAMDRGNTAEAKNLLAGIRDNEEKIKFHGQRADSIVKGMLQHARTSTGQKEATDINALAEEYLRLSYQGFRSRNKSFNAKMVTHFDPAIGKVELVSQEIGRVLLNLYNNAFYAVAPDSNGHRNNNEPTIWVTTKRIHSNQSGRPDNISITVRDNGQGVSSKVMDKIFQPFFTTKPTGQGTGLGLSLSYDIVKAHGGEIKVANHEAGGAEFTILIPDYKD
jgi:signal transduction histidine kinase